MSKKKLKIAVITQNDEYAIRDFKLLCESENIEISELIIVSSSSGSLNKNGYL